MKEYYKSYYYLDEDVYSAPSQKYQKSDKDKVQEILKLLKELDGLPDDKKVLTKEENRELRRLMRISFDRLSRGIIGVDEIKASEREKIIDNLIDE